MPQATTMRDEPEAFQQTDGGAPRRKHARLLGFGATALASSTLVGIGIATGREAASSDRVAVAARATIDHAPDEVASDAPSHPAAPPAGTSPEAAGVHRLAPEAAREVAPRMFDGRPLRAVRTMSMCVTAYSPDERSCGVHADGITASGYSVETNGGALVAADPRVLPLGSLVSVPGYDDGAVVPVLDVGGAIKGARLDVLFPTHERAVQWGVKNLEVTVWEYADGEPNPFRRQRRPSR